MPHINHAVPCQQTASPHKLGWCACWEHLPPTLQRSLWLSYRTEQAHGGRPTEEYLIAARAAQRWFKEQRV